MICPAYEMCIFRMSEKDCKSVDDCPNDKLFEKLNEGKFYTAVIRCKHCKYNRDGYCIQNDIRVTRNWYCADGEWRGNNA